jgi:hypothetical protein
MATKTIKTDDGRNLVIDKPRLQETGKATQVMKPKKGSGSYNRKDKSWKGSL